MAAKNGSEKQHGKDALNEIATGVGRVAGWVEASVELVREPHTEPRHDDIRFEHSDINTRGTFLAGVGVLVGIWIAIGLLFFTFRSCAITARKSARQRFL